MIAIPPFESWMAVQQHARAQRSARRAEEQQTGTPADDMGRYWLARTAQLELIAAEARRLTRADPGLCCALRTLLDELDAIPAPVCRPGDHQ